MLAGVPLIHPRRALGKTGFVATPLGIGDIADRKVPLEDLVLTARRALDAGLNLIDTAPGYEDGYSEQVVGAALKGRRRGVFLIDKVDHHDRPAIPQVEARLANLGHDHADLFVFHGVSEPSTWKKLAGPGGGMEQLGTAIKQGKSRFRGISSHHPDVLLAALESGLCDVVMFPIGPFVDERYVTRVLPLAKSKGVGTVCFKTFGAGKLLGDTSGYNQPLELRPRGKFSSGGKESVAQAQLPTLTVGECLHYTLTCDPDVALLGMSFPNEQDQAFEAFYAFKEPLSQAALARTRERAKAAIEGKGRVWWNPA